MNLLILFSLALSLAFWWPTNSYHGPTNHTRSRAYYGRHLQHLQAQRHRRTSRSHGKPHPSLIR